MLEAIDSRRCSGRATLLYDGALVAERYSAVGAFLDTRPPDADPTVAAIIRAARDLPAHRLASDLERLARYKAAARDLLAGFDALLMPTTTGHPTLAEVAADPVGVNARLGLYTNFVNLLDLAAVAVPAGTADGSPFGVSLIVRAFDDQIALDLAGLLAGGQAAEPYPTGGTDLVVFGAHLRGQPLNHQLTDLGARFAGEVATAPEYRMVALSTPQPKPGLVRDTRHGASLAGERWTLSAAALGTFLAALPHPMALGPIRLDTGESILGFHCDPDTAASGIDITALGSWRAYLAQRPDPNPRDTAAPPSPRPAKRQE